MGQLDYLNVAVMLRHIIFSELMVMGIVYYYVLFIA